MTGWYEQMQAEMDAEPYKAEIRPVGRWSWYIRVTRGLTGYGSGWSAYGTSARAERKARRIIARLEREDQRARRSWTISS